MTARVCLRGSVKALKRDSYETGEEIRKNIMINTHVWSNPGMGVVGLFGLLFLFHLSLILFANPEI